MKFLSFILFSLFCINIVHSVESTDPVDEILGEDVILPNMIQTNMRKFKVKDIQNEILNKVDRREYSCNGYIDLNIMKGSIVSENSSNNNLRFKSIQRPLNPHLPGADEVMLQKRGLSNGVVLLGRKRTANFETSVYNN